MGNEPSASGGHFVEESVLASVLDPAYRKLVAARDYDRLAELLEASLQRRKTQASPQAAGLITAAHGLCRACLDCREQEVHHQQLQETAVAREDNLRADLQRVLGLLDEGVGRGPPEEGEHRPGFWQRAWEVLGLVPAEVEGEPGAAVEDVTAEEETAPHAADAGASAKLPDLLALIRQSETGQTVHLLKRFDNRLLLDTAVKPAASLPGITGVVTADTAVDIDWPTMERQDPVALFWQSRRGKSVQPTVRFDHRQLLAGPATRATVSLSQPEKETQALPAELEIDLPPGKLARTARHSLVVYCLGPFRVYQNDELIAEWSSLKALAILKYIVARRGHPLPKDVLMEIIWPDVEPEAARRNLHQAVYSLRKTLRQADPEFQHIQFHNDNYLLNPEMDTWIDFVEFEARLREGRRHEAANQIDEALAAYSVAEGLYQGDFLEDDPYVDWAQVQREQLHNMYLNTADRLSKHYIRRMQYPAVIALCQKALSFEPANEAAHRRLMRCYIAQGQRHLAVRQYQTCRAALAEALDLAPSQETTILYQQLVAST